MNPLYTTLYIIAYLLTLVFVYFRFFYHRYNGFMQFVKNILLPLTVIGGWVVYFMGYHLGSEGASTFYSVLTHGFLALFSAGRLFVLGNDLIEIPHQIKEDPNFLLWFSLVGAMAVFLSISILLHVFGKRLITRMMIWLKLSKENHVFFGVNEASVSLGRNLIQRDRKRMVVFIKRLDPLEDASLYHSVEEIGALVINNESLLDSISLKSEESIVHVTKEHAEPVLLNRLKLIRKISRIPSHFYFLSDREEWNMSTARSVLAETNTFQVRNSITLHINIMGPDLEESFYKSLPPPSANIHIRLLNYPDIAARQLVASHNPIDWVEKATESARVIKDFNVMIIGFDQTGNAVLRKLVEYGQFPGSRFSATVTDKAMEVKKGRFVNSLPGVFSNYSIDFIKTDAGSSDFFDLIRKKMHSLDYIIITLGDDTLNIQTAVDIQQILIKHSVSRMKIIAQVKNNEHYKHLFFASEPVNVSVFGRVQDIFTEDIVVRGKLEAMAVRIHDYYNSFKPLPKQRKWEELTKIEQATNVSAAEHIYVKLKLAGIDYEEIKQIETIEDYTAFIGQLRMENLAKAEHLRWNAVLYTNGWDRWSLEDIPKNSTVNKDNARKLHACLVDWTELQEVSNRFGEDYYGYDYDIILNIFRLIKEEVYLPSS